MANNPNILHLDVDQALDRHLTGATMSNSLTVKSVQTIAHRDTVEILSCKTQSGITAHVLDEFPHLRLLITRTAGVDHIDLDACKQRSIAVYHIPDYGAHNIGEHALALLLAGSRGIVQLNHQTHNGRYDFRDYLGMSLHRKTIGVIGTGKIGLSLIKLLAGFGATIICYDVVHNETAATQYRFSYVSLEALLDAADAISIHVPLLPQTRYLIGDRELAIMRDGAVLVNTSRGAVIDESALIKHIGRFKAVCLDVVEDEKNFDKNHPLLKYDNVIITPHSAFYTDDSIKTIAAETRANIERFQKGDRTNRVV